MHTCIHVCLCLYLQIIQFCTSGVCLLVTVKLMTDGSQCVYMHAYACMCMFVCS